MIQIAPFFFALSIERQIGDERWVPVDDDDGRSGEVERELAGEFGCDDDEPAGLDVPLDRLLQLRRRIDQRQLEPDDWPSFSP